MLAQVGISTAPAVHSSLENIDDILDELNGVEEI
jgi:hypothetical protein